MDDLLVELTEKIFKLHTLDFLIKTVIYVCKRWRDIIYNMIEYKDASEKLNTYGFNSPRWQVFDVLRAFDVGVEFNNVVLNQLLFKKGFGPNNQLMRHYTIFEQLFFKRFKSLKKIKVQSPSINKFDITSLKLCSNVTKVDFQGCNFTDLSPILYLKKIKILKLMRCNNVENLYVIKDLVSLEQLYLESLYNIWFLPPLRKLKKLYKVKLYYISELYDISSMKNLNIRLLCIMDCMKLKDVDTIGTLKDLQTLTISFCPLIQHLDCLKTCKYLHYLDIENCKCVTTFHFINHLKSLQKLKLWKNVNNLKTLTLYDLPKLSSIDTWNCDNLTVLNFSNLPKLVYLDITNTKINNIKFINDIPSIKYLMMCGTSIYSLDFDVLTKCNLRKIQFHKITTSDVYSQVSQQYKKIKKINKYLKIKLPIVSVLF
mgnify:FL=1